MNKIYIKTDKIANCSEVKIRFDYEKGDYRLPRGYYLIVTAVSVTNEYGIEMESWSSDSPYQRYLVERVDRKSPKRFAYHEDKITANAEKIASAFEDGRYQDVWQYV